MKIAIPIYSFNKEGGIERHTYEMVKRWQTDHEIHLFCHDWQDFGWKNVSFHKVPALKSIFASPSFVINNSRMINKNDYDIVLNNGCGATFVQDVIVSASCHKAWAEEMKKANIKKWFLHPLHFWTFFVEGINYKYKRFKKVIAISDFIKKHLINYHKIPGESIEVIHLGVDIDEFDIINKEKIRKEMLLSYNIDNNKFILLFAGKEFKRKGLKYLIDAVALINDEKLHLMVVGEGEISLFKEYAKEKGLSNITFAGHSSSINRFYACSDVFVFPTTFDAFGLVVLEAMASSLAVISSSTAGASELINDGKDGIILKDYKDCKTLANNIKYLMENDIIRKKMGNLAKEKAKQNSWDKVSEKFLGVFKDIYERKN